MKRGGNEGRLRLPLIQLRFSLTSLLVPSALEKSEAKLLTYMPACTNEPL
jgi:hypothetical protein